MLSLLLWLLAASDTVRTPRAIVAMARAAVEGDSAAPIRARWSRQVETNPHDRLARLGLASLKRFADDAVGARSLLAAILAERADDSIALYAELARGWAGVGRESLDTTARTAHRAAILGQTIGDSAATVEALTLIGFARSRLGSQPGALDTLKLADQLVPAGEPVLHGLVRCTASPVMTFAGMPGARAMALDGLELARKAGDRRVSALCYHSVAQSMTNDSDDEALTAAYVDSAAAAARAGRDGWFLALVHFTRGFTRYIYFDIGGAKRALTESLAEAARSDAPFAAAWARRYLSMVYAQAGDLAAAEQEFKRAEELFTRLHDGMGLGNLQVGRAAAFVAQGRLDDAESIYRASLARSEQNRMGEGIYNAYANLASLAITRRRWDEALGWLDRAHDYGNSHGHSAWVPGLEWNYGLAYLGKNELDRAEGHLRRYLSTSGPTQYADQYAIWTRLADVAARRGNLRQSAEWLAAATDRLDSLRASLADEHLKLLVFQTAITARERDAGFAGVAARLVQGGMAKEVLHLSERRRARTLADRLLRSSYLEDDRTAIRELRRKLTELGRSDRIAVPDSSAILEFIAGTEGQPSSVLVVTRDTVRGYVLPPVDSIAPMATRVAALLETGSAAAVPARLLGRALLDDALAGLPARINRLILVPDDLLHRIPFDALRLANGSQVVERFAVSRAPSAALAASSSGAWSTGAEPAPLLAIGDPRFAEEKSAQGNPDTELFREAFDATGGLERLKASGEEAEAVARFSPRAVLRERDEASEAYLKHTALTGFRVLHFATHALVDGTAANRSALALSPGGGEDGFVGPAELAGLRLDADLVVLSACRTAGGVVVGGEGVQGLTAPLLAAGARAVLATLWRVPDRPTGRFIESFYRQLAAGLTAGDALRAAKLRAIAQGEAPVVWAAFTLVGDPTVRPGLILPRNRWTRPLVLAMVLLLVLGGRRLLRQRPGNPSSAIT
jgi:tetratricopeptide (TPR) repeat protein